MIGLAQSPTPQRFCYCQLEHDRRSQRTITKDAHLLCIDYNLVSLHVLVKGGQILRRRRGSPVESIIRNIVVTRARTCCLDLSLGSLRGHTHTATVSLINGSAAEMSDTPKVNYLDSAMNNSPPFLRRPREAPTNVYRAKMPILALKKCNNLGLKSAIRYKARHVVTKCHVLNHSQNYFFGILPPYLQCVMCIDHGKVCAVIPNECIRTNMVHGLVDWGMRMQIMISENKGSSGAISSSSGW